MSNSADATGQRRAARGLEDATNKKKQKDQANQESKEAKRAASSSSTKECSPRPELTDSSQETDLDEMLIDWKQNSDEIIVKLNPGVGTLKVEDVDAAFSDTDCLIKLPDGRQWSCNFYEEIESSCSKIQYKEKGNILQLVLHKKIPLHKWPGLLKKKDGMREQGKVAMHKENEKKPLSQLILPEQPQSPTPSPESTEPKRSKQEPRNVKRAQERRAAMAGTIVKTATPEMTSSDLGGQMDPSANCAIPLRAAVPEKEPSSRPAARSLKLNNFEESTLFHCGKVTIHQNARVPHGAEPTAQKVAAALIDPQAANSEEAEDTEKEKITLEKQGLSFTSEMCIPHPVSSPHLHEKDLQTLSLLGEPKTKSSEQCEPKVVEKVTEGQQHLASEEKRAEVRDHAMEVAPRIPSPDSFPRLREDKEKGDQSKEDVSLEETAEDPEPIVSLTFVKNDFYEKGTDAVVVHVYVKEICKPMSRVLFREQDFTLVFQTSDVKFLRLHPDCGPNTVFRWQVKLRNLIEPDRCSYSFTGSRIDIHLKKRHSQRWGGLEAPAARGAVGGAKVALPAGPTPLDKTQPASNQHPLSSKEEARAGEKEKPRAEDSLDGVASRTTAEHISVKQEPLVALPKPTCMVPPMTHSLVSSENVEEEEEKKVCVPGFTGLVNLGNTCFMNSVIQSLSNTRELRDYFHDRSFESEINCSNPLGTGGRLAIGFAVLLRALWKGTHHAFQPSKLKAIVASKASQFTGYAQHDAQEFMAFLLDGLHEDLNRIQNKPYTETVDSDGRPDEVVAEEAWQRHKMRNDSFVVDLFQGQYKSKLVCPICSKVSITFDPFLYLPVPLPQKQKVLTVYYFAKEPHKKPVKFLVSISKENSNASEVLDSISHSVRVKPENLRLAEVIKNSFQRVFQPSNSLDTISPANILFCFEVLSTELAKERVVVLQVQQRTQVPSIPITKCAACQKKQQSEEEKLKRCTRCYRVGYCNQVCQKTHWPDHKSSCRPENIGYPFLISIPESRLTYSRLTQLLEGYARFSVSVFQPPFQPGRMSPEQASRPLTPEKMDALVKNSCPVATEAGDRDRDFHPMQAPQLLPSATELHPESGDYGAVLSKTPMERNSLLSSNSGFLEHTTESISDLGCEKETSYEKAIRPEAAIPGYQQPVVPLTSPATQFYINLIDSANKEMKLEDKGEILLELPESCSLALVWKNNERLKEFVLVESKELEFVEDPGSASEAARAGHFTLEQCLNLFTKPEVLAPEEAWYCPKCKQHREASKQLMLWRLPNVLIIQLKRFSFRSFIWRDKINDMVEFPVRNLDLSKFCIGQKEDHQLPIYDLYAVINHYGGMIGGHYTAYARLPNDKNSQRSDVGWRLFDDSTVTTVEESQVVTRYAYVLFYRRRNSPVERPLQGHVADHRTEMAASAEGAASQKAVPAETGALIIARLQSRQNYSCCSTTQGVGQMPFGPDLDPEGAPQLTAEAVSDLFPHPTDCPAPPYSNMEEVD
ncbi:ubiquitin carboxyl-terminal hydrolase 19 isoform X3 [Rhinatrema bivittatum]|uniref:ubiquitin carboxyl-terminal hydrolase 19 isoform X3 n=1 Tax=Rhinatrema bivittatum TaxID=194408 RepID=UPI0011260E6B|nr:ubiquitin carboxyl-terminal hydrolase 19 isoform X3 [Rhinatrema bivittatum]